jgi:hypothetical protein
VNLTRHAEARRVEFGLPWEDVAEILDDPDITRPSGEPDLYPEGCRVHHRGDWTVVVAPDGETVITILPWQIEDWEH